MATKKLPWLDKAADFKKITKSKKDQFIDIISEYSFNVPALNKRLSSLKLERENISSQIEEGYFETIGNFCAIYLSTSQINEFPLLADHLSKILSEVYRTKRNSKFLDYVVSSDWGKFMLLHDECRLTIIKAVVDAQMYKISDELASLLLKIATTAQGREDIGRSVGSPTFLTIFLDLITAVYGRSGGLLRNAAFLTRRENNLKSGTLEFSAQILTSYLKNSKFDAVTRFSIISLTSRCFYINLVDVISELTPIDSRAASFCLMTMSRPFLVWSTIQKECLQFGANKFPATAISNTNLKSFYLSLNNGKVIEEINRSQTVGIVITTFDPDIDLIGFAISSIQRQTYRNIKICIVDDCSKLEVSKKLAQLITDLNDDRIILTRNSHNVGQYVSRNTAIDLLADAEFIAIQDDDDFSHPERIAHQVKSLEDNPDASLVMCKQARFNENMQYVPDKVDPSVFDPSPASSFFRRKIVDDIGRFSDVRSRGDVEFLTRIRTKYGIDSVCVIDAVMYLMRCTPETVSASKDRLLKTQIDVFRRFMANGHDQSIGLRHHALHK